MHNTAASMLRDITSERARNLVRGFLSPNSETVARRTMENLRRECSFGDALVAFRFLRDSPLANHIPKADPFPNELSEVEPVPFYGGSRFEIEVAAQAVRMELEAERLVDAIKLVGFLNKAILTRDGANVATVFAEYRARFGLSLMVAAKAISLRHSRFTGLRSSADYSEVLTPFLSPRRQVVTAALEDSIDPDRDYVRVRRSFLAFVREGRLKAQDAAIVADFLSPLEQYGFEADQRVQAFGRWGLLDTVAYLFRLRALLVRQGRTRDVAAVDAAIPAEVTAAWRSAFESIDLNVLQEFVGKKSQFFDRVLFSHLPAWSECPALHDHRMRVEWAIGPRLDGNFPVSRRVASTFALPKPAVIDLLGTGPLKASLGDVDLRSCGAFHRTIALIASLEAGAIEADDGEQLNLLLDQTLDVANMLSLDELKAFLPSRRDDELYEYLRAALINDVESSKVSNHALRRALQRVVRERFDGDIVKLLGHVDSENGHVSNHLYYLCTESFLTELYELYEQADEVTEAQPRILEWRGERRNDADALLRAKSHRLNLRLRKVRGAIEVTRIYVDPLRFIQWIEDDVGGDLRAIVSLADEIVADPDTSVSLRDPVRTALQPRYRLLKLLDNCYSEFCTNKIYGVTSFIGRRIRHGTLYGHLVLELRPEIDCAIKECRASAPRFAEFLANWLFRFDAAVQAMAADRIHVRSKEKPKGLIVATLDDPDKAAVAKLMLGEVALSMRDRSLLAHSYSIIHEYCWILFEVDLKRTREAFEVLRREFVIGVDQHRCTDIPELDQRITERIRALNSNVQHRFDIVRSWLTRPTSVSPSASVALLFEAVLDEVRQRYVSFKPKLNVSGAEDIDLIGHRFHFFYDALYILVDNAGKHGEVQGQLRVEVTSRSAEGKYVDLTVSIVSDLVTGKEDGAKSRIEDAMNAEIGDAMVSHGNTGIRKLRGLVADVDEIKGFKHAYDGNAVVFTIHMRYLKS